MCFLRKFITLSTIVILMTMSYGINGQEIDLFNKIISPHNTILGNNEDQMNRFELNKDALNTLYHNDLKTTFKLIIDNKQVTINLNLIEISEPNHFIQEFKDGQLINHQIRKPHTYRGEIIEYPNSFIALTTDNNNLRALISIPNMGQYNIGKDFATKNDNIYIISHDNDLTEMGSFACSANDELFYREINNLDTRSIRSTCKKVRISIHVDYDLYLQKNRNMQLVANYVFGLFNESGTLFLNEGIHTSISEIIVHTREDNLPHTSADEDLSQFKRDFTSYNGDLIICLSGYRDGQGNAPLGGTAYTNSLCIKRYSYAYANVYGNYSKVPNFSWDVQVFTHEIGHILGSPHTHSCTWGPQQNEALDDCYPTTGGCAPGPRPIKGTIMSYCHLPGRPGIDFTYGFGQEPGDRIRAKIESSFCLIDYVPERNIPTSKGVIQANVECSDGNQTHYYFDNNTIDESDDIWLLSVDTRGQNIGHIGERGFEVSVEVTSNSLDATEITADYVDPNKPYFVINKHWTFKTNSQPSIPVTIEFPFSQKEYESLKRQVTGTTIEKLTAYLIRKPGNSNPATNHSGTKTQHYDGYEYSRSKGSKLWNYDKSAYGYHIASYQVDRLEGGGIGVHADSPLPVELIYFDAQRIENTHHLNWATGYELNMEEFLIERSKDGYLFNEIGSIASNGDVLSKENYLFIDEAPLKGTNYYRLKFIDLDKSFSYSPIVQLHNNESEYALDFIISPNPIIDGQMHLYQQGIALFEDIEIKIRDISGKTHLQNQVLKSDKMSMDINTLTKGLYFVEINTDNKKFHKKVLIQ